MKFIFKKNYSVKVWFKNMIKKPAYKNTDYYIAKISVAVSFPLFCYILLHIFK